MVPAARQPQGPAPGGIAAGLDAECAELLGRADELLGDDLGVAGVLAAHGVDPTPLLEAADPAQRALWWAVAMEIPKVVRKMRGVER